MTGNKDSEVTERNGRWEAWTVVWPSAFSPGLEGGREEVKMSGTESRFQVSG